MCYIVFKKKQSQALSDFWGQDEEDRRQHKFVFKSRSLE